jgi:hypothetical protein
LTEEKVIEDGKSVTWRRPLWVGCRSAQCFFIKEYDIEVLNFAGKIVEGRDYIKVFLDHQGLRDYVQKNMPKKEHSWTSKISI